MVNACVSKENPLAVHKSDHCNRSNQLTGDGGSFTHVVRTSARAEYLYFWFAAFFALGSLLLAQDRSSCGSRCRCAYAFTASRSKSSSALLNGPDLMSDLIPSSLQDSDFSTEVSTSWLRDGIVLHSMTAQVRKACAVAIKPLFSHHAMGSSSSFETDGQKHTARRHWEHTLGL